MILTNVSRLTDEEKWPQQLFWNPKPYDTMNDNLPPGVSDADLPGNRPIDNYFEQVFEIISQRQPEFADAVRADNDLLEEAGTYISDAFHTDKSPFSAAVDVYNGLKDRCGMADKEELPHLKPCPFCGGKNQNVFHYQKGLLGMRWHFVKCGCGARTGNYASLEIAIEKWNERTN